MKYLIVKAEHSGAEEPIVFHRNLEYSQVAGRQKVVSAGFCGFSPEGALEFWGESFKLGFDHRPEDQRLLEKFFDLYTRFYQGEKL